MKKYDVQLTPRALADLDEIHATIAIDDPQVASRFVGQIFARINRLVFMPERYGVAPEARLFREPLHHVTVWPYRIVYRVATDQVQIITIRHGKRRPLGPSRG